MVYNEIGKTGMQVSNLSFGASSLGGVFHSIKENEGIQQYSQPSKTVSTSSMCHPIMAI